VRGAAPESESSKDALLAAVSESSSVELPVADLAEPGAEAAEPAAPQPPAPPARKWRRRITLVLEALLVVALAAVCWLRFTERGLETWANVAGNVGWESLFHGSQVEAEQQAAANLKKRGALVIVEPPDRRVTNVNLQGLKVDDDLLAQVAKFYRLASLTATGCTITDDQLRCLASLTSLTSLALDGTPITDAGLTHLCGLSNLISLQLAKTKVSDAGLHSLTSFHNLKTLDLSGTQVTDKGLKELASLDSLNMLILTDTDISNAGLPDLATMKNLHNLILGRNSKITLPAIVRLRKAIPGLRIEKAD
jgi:hypothetical protein